jgi:hypothetical protein
VRRAHVQRSDALLQRQQRLVDLRALQARLTVVIRRVRAALAAGEVDEGKLPVRDLVGGALVVRRGVELKGVRSGVERRRGRGLKARDPGRRDAPGRKVLKDRRSPRVRGRTGTSVILERTFSFAAIRAATDGGI